MAGHMLTNKAIEYIAIILDYAYEVESANQADNYFSILNYSL